MQTGQARVWYAYEQVTMALLRTAGIASGLSRRRVVGAGVADSRSIIREIWAAFQTAMRASGEAIQTRRRALFFCWVMAVPVRQLKQQPLP